MDPLEGILLRRWLGAGPEEVPPAALQGPSASFFCSLPGWKKIGKVGFQENDILHSENRTVNIKKITHAVCPTLL